MLRVMYNLCVPQNFVGTLPTYSQRQQERQSSVLLVRFIDRILLLNVIFVPLLLSILPPILLITVIDCIKLWMLGKLTKIEVKPVLNVSKDNFGWHFDQDPNRPLNSLNILILVHNFYESSANKSTKETLASWINLVMFTHNKSHW